MTPMKATSREIDVSIFYIDKSIPQSVSSAVLRDIHRRIFVAQLIRITSRRYPVPFHQECVDDVWIYHHR